VARHTAPWLAGTSAPAIPAGHWAGTTVVLPGGRWTGLMAEGEMQGGVVDAADLFGDMPVAAWLSHGAS
jgi:(1->4)-alpha-D-glucan 1-alpha-D-glucosylmutase